MSTELIERVDVILGQANLADRPSFFQIEKFIIGKEVTTQAQLWQIVKELEARRETVDSLNDQLADAEDQLEMFEVEIERLNLKLNYLKVPMEMPPVELNPSVQHYSSELQRLEMQEIEINIRKAERKRDALAKAARKVSKKRKFILEEMNCLVAAFDKVIVVAGEVKSIDDRDAQREMWNEKYLEEFNLRVLLKRPMDSEFIRCVMALEDDAPVKKHVIDLLTRQQQLMVESYQRQQAAQRRGELNQAVPEEAKAAGTIVCQDAKPRALPPKIQKENIRPPQPFVPEHQKFKPKSSIVGRKKR